MKKLFSVVLVCVFAFGMTACGGGSSSGGGTAQAGSGSGTNTTSVNGTYTGSLASTVIPFRATLTVDMKQDGDKVGGTFRVTNVSSGAFTCFPRGTFAGEIEGNGITFGIASAGGSARFRGTVGAGRIEGSYVVTSGSCSGDRGSFSLTR